jgi:hypothetical protein
VNRAESNKIVAEKSSKLSAGDWVEVRSKEEILRTLDGDGKLDGMPFMPEMFAFCGKQFQVYKRAHKTCDTVFPVRGRRVSESVHLDTRCDGALHGGCQASCLIFWKDAWLKPASKNSATPRSSGVEQHAGSANGNAPGSSHSSECTESIVFARTQTADSNPSDPTYSCQATQLPYATTELDWWDIRQYVEDYRSGNVGLWRIICGITYFSFMGVTQVIAGPTLRRLYDKFHKLWGGTPYPRKTGTIPDGQPTPAEDLNLQPGELVRIKSHDEILATLNVRSRNRGLYWDAEEVPYCGGTYQVLKRVTKIINERTGKMRVMQTPSVILDSVICESRYSECRLFCPRSIYSYWREIWLERVTPAASQARSPEEIESVARQ